MSSRVLKFFSLGIGRHYSQDNLRYYVKRPEGFICYESRSVVVLNYNYVGKLATEREASQWLRGEAARLENDVLSCKI